MAITAGNGIASGAMNTNTTNSSSSSTVVPNTRTLQAELIVSNHTTGDYNIIFQCSGDSGSTWQTMGTSMTQSSNGTLLYNMDIIAIAEAIGIVRIQITSTNVVTTGATVEGKLWCESI